MVAKANFIPFKERQSSKGTAPIAPRGAAHGARAALTELDRLVHEQIRLGILSALAVNVSLSFSDLKNILKTTDGNLSVHARKLEEAGYVKCRKFFNGRLPQTEFELTLTGRDALDHYLDQMEALIQATRAR
jgi:DNA-binding MarR family transcriptional regulator